MIFWITATALATIVALILVLPLLRPLPQTEGGAQDVHIYRDQLAEVDRDLERGLLDPADAERTRTEIARRLLAADTQTQAQITTAPKGATRITALLAAAATVLGTLAIYAQYGAPGYPDIPLASRIAASEDARDNRISQLAAEQLIAQTGPTRDATPEQTAQLDALASIVATDPNDSATWARIVTLSAEVSDYSTAARAQQQVIALAGNDATVGDTTRLAILMILAAQGYVSPEAEGVLRQVLEADPDNLAAQYYYGVLFFETDRPDRAFALFRDVLNAGEDNNPFVQLSRNLVEEAAFRAGIDYSLPPLRGPSIDDITAAQDLSDDDRNAMIADMVNRLSTRLANEGGPVEEWARLINALGVLGDTDQATAILREARSVFAGSQDAMEALDFVAGMQRLDE